MWIHFTPTEISEINDAKQTDCLIPNKPSGLWVIDREFSLGWLEYAHRHSLKSREWRFGYQIQLAEVANIKWVQSRDDMRELSARYPYQHGEGELPYSPPLAFRYLISWASLAKDYDGIIVSPYMPWENTGAAEAMNSAAEPYSLWDFPGGCIWRERAVERVAQIYFRDQ